MNYTVTVDIEARATDPEAATQQVAKALFPLVVDGKLAALGNYRTQEGAHMLDSLKEEL